MFLYSLERVFLCSLAVIPCAQKRFDHVLLFLMSFSALFQFPLQKKALGLGLGQGAYIVYRVYTCPGLGQGRRKRGAPPPIISICESKTHKRTRKVRKQFRFILEPPSDLFLSRSDGLVGRLSVPSSLYNRLVGTIWLFGAGLKQLARFYGILCENTIHKTYKYKVRSKTKGNNLAQIHAV